MKGKVVVYATRNKRCCTCDAAEREKQIPKKHDCRRCHVGSSKSMEPAVAVQLAQEAKQQNVKIACMVGDDDASTVKFLNEVVG